MSEPSHSVLDSVVTPRWILLFGLLLVVIGVGAGLLGIFVPTKFFNDFPAFDQWTEISYVTTGWGIRNIAMGTAMIIALWLGVPSAIGVVFCMRFLTELGDLLNTLVSGHGLMGLPLGVVAAGWIVIFLIPEALAARWGILSTLASRHRKSQTP